MSALQLRIMSLKARLQHDRARCLGRLNIDGLQVIEELHCICIQREVDFQRYPVDEAMLKH